MGKFTGVPFAPRLVCAMVEDVAARHVIGRSPHEIENMWRIIYSDGFVQRPDISTGGVLSGLEIACWDIMGKAMNQPVYNLLGGKVHERLRSYTYLYPEEQPNAGVAKDFHGDINQAPARLQQYMDMGFTAVGYDPVMPMGSFDPRQLSLGELERAEKMTREMREVAGSKCDLMIKTHGQYDNVQRHSAGTAVGKIRPAVVRRTRTARQSQRNGARCQFHHNPHLRW